VNLLDLANDYAANPATYDAKPKLAPIPNGPYTFVINKCEEHPYLAQHKKDEMVGACVSDPSLQPGKRVEIECEILDEGPYKGRKIWLKKIIDPASDQKDRGKMSVEAIVSSDRKDIVSLAFKRLKVTPEEVQVAGYAAMTNKVARLMVSQYVSGGETRNDIKVYVDCDNGAPAPVANTVRPVVAVDDGLPQF
jgi:hypothetical protein